MARPKRATFRLRFSSSVSICLATQWLPMNDVSDRIEKQMILRSPRSRVWRAIADSQEFGSWFGVELDGPWIAGKPVKGRFKGEFSQEMIDEWLK